MTDRQTNTQTNKLTNKLTDTTDRQTERQMGRDEKEQVASIIFITELVNLKSHFMIAFIILWGIVIVPICSTATTEGKKSDARS